MASQKSTSKKRKGSGFVVGSARFRKISAVEGIEFGPGMKGRAAISKSEAESPAERRKAIIRAYRKT
ncbi:hypothetical protein [Bradyrhizobium sp.]|uniref:hypothetical protein n=1 Tax=Bradyrhizobium sp. TaxID=376 RepID=UPI004037EA8C